MTYLVSCRLFLLLLLPCRAWSISLFRLSLSLSPLHPSIVVGLVTGSSGITQITRSGSSLAVVGWVDELLALSARIKSPR